MCACKGVCDSIPKPKAKLSWNDKDRKNVFYNGKKKWCSECFRWFEYRGGDSRCICCNYRCRIRAIHWVKGRRDTRKRIG